MNRKSIALLLALAAAGTGMTSCAGNVEHTQPRNFYVTGYSGDQQYGASVQVYVTARKLINIGGYADAIDEHKYTIQSIVEGAGLTLRSTADEDLLAIAVEAALTDQLKQLEAQTYGRVSADRVMVTQAYNYPLRCQMSLEKYIASNPNVQGGSCSGVDSPDKETGKGDGYITASTFLKEPRANEQRSVPLQCAVNGQGCKEEGQALTPIYSTGMGTPANTSEE